MTPGAGAADSTLARRPPGSAPPPGAREAGARPRVAGKFLAVGERKLYPRGATYGAFEPDADGHEYHDLDVVDRDFEAMAAQAFDAVRIPHKRFRDTHRRHVRTAEKQGVEVAPARSAADVDAYVAIYRHSLVRWGDGATGFYPPALFRNLAASSAYGEGIRLLLARRDGVVIGGIVIVTHGDQAVYWHGVSDAAQTAAHPSPLLLVTAMRQACDEGLRWFDFMGPNEHLKGVQHFKDGFASERLPYDAYYSRSGLRGLLFARYRELKEQRLHRCPL